MALVQEVPGQSKLLQRFLPILAAPAILTYLGCSGYSYSAVLNLPAFGHTMLYCIPLMYIRRLWCRRCMSAGLGCSAEAASILALNLSESSRLTCPNPRAEAARILALTHSLNPLAGECEKSYPQGASYPQCPGVLGRCATSKKLRSLGDALSSSFTGPMTAREGWWRRIKGT